MKIKTWMSVVGLLTLAVFGGCRESADHGHDHGAHEAEAPVAEKGIHNGRLLHDQNFTLELAIFETGVPPEYRAWAYVDGKAVAPSAVAPAPMMNCRRSTESSSCGSKPPPGSDEKTQPPRAASV